MSLMSDISPCERDEKGIFEDEEALPASTSVIRDHTYASRLLQWRSRHMVERTDIWCFEGLALH